jgi:Flp pilus assembly protein TadG
VSSQAGSSSSRPAGSVRTGQRRPGRGDRGSAAVEFALGAPLLMLLVGLLVQIGLWAIGDDAARNAANHALQITRVVGGTVAAGREDAAALLQQNGGWFVDEPTITVTRTPKVTTVTIRGHARAIIPASLIAGVQPVITITVQGPTERLTP